MDSASITQTIGLVKQAIKAASSLTNLEIKDALIAAREALNDQRETNLTLRDENHELKEKIAELIQALRKNEAIEPGVDCYVKTLADGSKHAICSKCWETDSVAVSLQESGGSYPDCPNCKNYFRNVPKGAGYTNLPRR